MVRMELGKDRMTNEFNVLVDSDAFVGWMIAKDPHYKRASEVFEGLIQANTKAVTTSMVVAETATVLSHKVGQSLAITFLDTVIDKGKFPVIHINERLYAKALDIFKQQTKKGSSVVDCVNVAVMRQFGIKQIFSFDKVYKKSFDLASL